MVDNTHFTSMMRRIPGFLASRQFYWAVLGLFGLESAWIAVSALYPQAFDENFHFGLIRVYSHYWLPFLSGQPPDANAYGAVAHDPSYLYHYLMSFPYRVIELFVHGQAAQIVILRFIDIGIVAGGLVLFRRVMLRAGLSRALANVSLAVFVLIPIVPQLAAQVSYDDLLFLLVAWVCLLTFTVIDELRSRRLSFRPVGVLAVVLVLTTLVKYAFLPIAFGTVVFVLGYAWYEYRENAVRLWKIALKGFRYTSRATKFVLIGLFVVAAGMFMQRDGVNFAKYHAAVPNCTTFLSVDECSQYSPWYVDYVRHQKVKSGETVPSKNLISYTHSWFYWMWYRLYFAVNGLASKFYSHPPLPLPGWTAVAVIFAGALAFLVWHRRILSNPYAAFLFTITVIYLAALFVKGYATYHHTAVLENMNGRYLVPVLFPIAILIGLGLSRAFRRAPVAKSLVAVACLLLLVQGGGTLNFIVRSGPKWYWPNHTVQTANKTAQKIISPFIIK